MFSRPADSQTRYLLLFIVIVLGYLGAVRWGTSPKRVASQTVSAAGITELPAN